MERVHYTKRSELAVIGSLYERHLLTVVAACGGIVHPSTCCASRRNFVFALELSAAAS